MQEASELAMQDYLKPNVSTIDESKFTFAARSRMIDLRCNYKGQYSDSDVLCPLCGKEEDNQPHLLVCEELPEKVHWWHISQPILNSLGIA